MSNYLDKVRKLLNQAEDPSVTTAEADAFKETAYNIMVKHSIDETMLSLNDVADVVISIMKQFKMTYGISKASLFNAIASAHRCKSVKLLGTEKKYHIFGYRSDIESTEALYTMLLLHAESMLIKTRIPDGVHMKTFTSSWWAGYVNEIHSRLNKAKADIDADLEPGTVIVLRDRALNAEAAQIRTYPKLGKAAKRYYRSSAAFNAGKAAGKNANFGDTSINGNVGRRSISNGS